jgi:hypothetical protein
MNPPADFHPFLIDASWYDAYWYDCPPAEKPVRIGGFPTFTAILGRLRATDWRHLSGARRKHAVGGHVQSIATGT